MPAFTFSNDERDDLGDFERRAYTFDTKTRDVYLKGSGPAVVVVHEVPGITPEVAGFKSECRPE